MLNDKYHIQLSYFSVLAYFHGQADYFVFFCLIFAFRKHETSRKKQHCKNTQKEIHRNKKSKYFFSFLEIKKK